MASGAGIGKEFAGVSPVEDSYDYFERLTSLLGDEPEDWRQVPVKELIEKFQSAIDRDLMSHCCPHIDGLIIPKDPAQSLEDKDYADVPYLLSTNSDDMAPQFLHQMSKDFCNTFLICKTCYNSNYRNVRVYR